MPPQSRAAAKRARVMRECYRGTLHSGSKTGPIVHKVAQCKAIAISEGNRVGKKGKKKGQHH